MSYTVGDVVEFLGPGGFEKNIGEITGYVVKSDKYPGRQIKVGPAEIVGAQMEQTKWRWCKRCADTTAHNIHKQLGREFYRCFRCGKRGGDVAGNQ